jgi:hypothetical protein
MGSGAVDSGIDATGTAVAAGWLTLTDLIAAWMEQGTHIACMQMAS